MPLSPRSFPLLAASLLLVGALAACTPAAAPGPAPAPSRSAGTGTPISDFDGDGSADVVVGAAGDPASVQVRYADGRVQAITRADVDGTDLRTRFGASVLARDLNSDGFADLAIADRGDDSRNQALFLVPGSADGLQPGSARRYDAPRGVGRFGSALAFVEEPDPLLVVGAPADVEGGYRGGAIVTYRLGDDGVPRPNPDVFTQDAAGMPAKAEPGDRFGESLSASGSLLLIGVPLEDVGSVREAGAVVLLNFTHYGFDGIRVSKSSAGVSGTPRTGDFFGLSVAIGDGYAVVGVPGQDAGGRVDAGSVQPFRVQGATLVPEAAIDQDSAGVPDSNEAGDRFGTAVALVRACAGVTGTLVGGPGEGVGKARAAGAAWLVPFGSADGCPPRQFSGANGLGPGPVAGKRNGTAVAALRGSDRDSADSLLVAGPGDAASGGGTVFLVPVPKGAVQRPFTTLRTPFGISLSPAR